MTLQKSIQAMGWQNIFCATFVAENKYNSCKISGNASVSGAPRSLIKREYFFNEHKNNEPWPRRKKIALQPSIPRPKVGLLGTLLLRCSSYYFYYCCHFIDLHNKQSFYVCISMYENVEGAIKEYEVLFFLTCFVLISQTDYFYYLYCHHLIKKN